MLHVWKHLTNVIHTEMNLNYIYKQIVIYFLDSILYYHLGHIMP